MAGRASYSEEDKARIYVALTTHDGNVKRTARELGVPPSTVRRFRDIFAKEGPPAAEIVEVAAGEFLGDAERVRHKALLAIDEKIPNAKVSELITVVGVLDDKIARAKGLATNRTEHVYTLPSADEVRSLLGNFVQQAVQAAQQRDAEIIEAEVVEQADLALPPSS